ncbi:MAG: outer membrane protein assembly factor BamE [Kiloniellales bacterium]
MARLVCSLCLALWAAGCTGTINQRGNLPDPERLQEIEIGRHGRLEVADILGSPSTIGSFSDKRWYYISRRTSRLAFLKPEILDQRVVVIDFDDDGIVRSVRELTADDRREIEMVGRTTPTAGQSITVVQQLLGNVGRFNKPPGK